MSFFALLLLFFFVFFIVMPIVRVLLTVHRVRKQSNAFFEQMRQAQQGSSQPHSSQHTGYRNPFEEIFEQMARAQQYEKEPEHEGKKQPAQKPKKIAKDVGEYIEFQEIITTTKIHTPDGDIPTFETENQIIDVEWQDLPEK